MNKTFTILLTILLALLPACNTLPPSPSAAESPSPTQAATLPFTATPTLEPTLTPTPLAPRAILLAPPGSDAALQSVLETGLRPALEQAGWQFQTLSTLDLQPDVRLVIALPPDSGLAALAASAPTVQFLALAIPGLPAAPNLSVIGPQGLRVDQQSFAAGSLAAMLTADWRVGVLSPSDTVDGRTARQAFWNGAVYYCGLCLPYHGPIVDYPVFAELPLTASSAEWQAAAQLLIAQTVKTVYLPASVTDPLVYQELAQAGVLLIGDGAPPAELQSRWAASIAPDLLTPALALLPDLLVGRGGAVVSLSYTLQFVNPDLLSPGRQARIQEILANLQSGYIDTGVDPLTGAPTAP